MLTNGFVKNNISILYLQYHLPYLVRPRVSSNTLEYITYVKG